MALNLRRSKELYKRAVEVIPGGSQMFNKRPSIYHPAHYPIFAERSEGAYLYDVDGNRYIDYLLAYGAILLGYNYKPVQDAVKKQVDLGTIHSVNDPLEVELAEEMSKTIPSAEMVRYYLSGSEATTAAVRIARAHTGREKIIKGGYHGWHDWTRVVRGGPTKGMTNYLKMINCPLESIGHVPISVSQNSIELEYNNLDYLKNVLKKEGEEIACVIMEPFYFELPREGFLENLISLAHEYGCVVIFDEVKTGARVSYGGAQEYLKVIPDMSVFSKAIANGYSFSVVAGKKSIMKTCENLWFAGTNSGNAIGMRAALTTMKESKKIKAVEYIRDLGEYIMKGIEELIRIYEIDGTVGGVPAMPMFVFNNSSMEKKQKITAMYLDELINNGIFMPIEHCFYISYSHTREDMQNTLTAIEKAFKRIKSSY
jgi:glutamate-1-semialdehyde 2,1-aminomutase